MKFAKELDENAIPEWKTKYFDYKGAKKKLKAVGRATRSLNASNNARTSPLLSRRSPFGNASSIRDAPVLTFLNRAGGQRDDGFAQDDNRQNPLRTDSWLEDGEDEEERTPRAIRPMAITNERSPLRTDERSDGAPRLARYGSIIGSPPSGTSPTASLRPVRTQASLLELPDPALDPADDESQKAGSQSSDERQQGEVAQHCQGETTRRQLAHTGNAYSIQPASDEQPRAGKHKGHTSFFTPKRTTSAPDANARPAFMQRMFSISGPHTLSGADRPTTSRPRNDVALESYREVDFRQAEFMLFLDKQLDKIEQFYQSKEDEATSRLAVLREQLHVLRNRRLEEVVAAEERHKQHEHRRHTMAHARTSLENEVDALAMVRSAPPHPDLGTEDTHGNDTLSGLHSSDLQPDGNVDEEGGAQQNGHTGRWASVASQVNNTLANVRTGHVGKTSKAMGELGTPSSNQFRTDPGSMDYTKRKVKETVPAYRAAKRKLKTALQEFYRGLELLKSYALLNRTAFRKINKKFDKTINAPPGSTMRYMSEKVNKAHFVTSDVIDSHLQAIEDLYARYFERGNRKVAIGKLRGKTLTLGDYTGALCRMGFFLGSGLVLSIQGLVYGVIDVVEGNSSTHIWTTYLLQIYAGYFLFLLLVALFTVDARIFSRAKVNYQFVFEFDARHTLDWRQLAEIPSVFFFIFALTMYLNFTPPRIGGDTMFIYWPVILVGLSLIIMFLPPGIFYWEARRWFLYSTWRLFASPFYPVEFRDFFLGDMLCSQTYAMGNIELFFCAYAKDWDPDRLPTCSSSSSRLLGFFSALPGIWRALQCLRRYYDTRMVFPHLVNCGKYLFTISQYMTLSIFRIHKSHTTKAAFITCSAINAIYCSFWDVYMDWSLGNPASKNRFLRDTLAYKRQKWFYYLAMIIDPLLRFNWVFYAIFADDVQHSSIISFSVAISEVFRRGMWTLLRVENEHCTNVMRSRATREVDLPYTKRIGSPELFSGDGTAESITRRTSAEDEENPAPADHESGAQDGLARQESRTTGREQRAQASTPSSSSVLRQRRPTGAQSDSPVAQALKRVGNTIAAAHSQDYEKKRKPVQDVQEEGGSDDEDDDDDDDGHDERENEVERNEIEQLRERASRRS